jgi:hypothetical protein
VGPMGMTADNQVKAGRVDLQLRRIVEEVDPKASQLDGFNLRQHLPKQAMVHITMDRHEGGDLFHGGGYLGCAHVPGMKDQVDALEKSGGLESKKTVSIGYDADMIWAFLQGKGDHGSMAPYGGHPPVRQRLYGFEGIIV